ncbi:unnamed protein product [Mytilus coruscus]|uniref:Uncharacterized protein n=1 Tax=Mytilus coruscus TaxID=42192 RepID=A0A6J8E9S5_MYTCO|nr:unnamed protein product [Mytilus coruscus]
MCLGGINAPDDVNAYLTHLAPDGQASILQPCPYNYDGHECFGCGSVNYGVSQKKDNTNTSAIFERTVQDDKSILSIEDRQCFTLMQTELQKDKDVSIQDASKAELHTFFDTSQQAIAAVATLSSSDGIVRKVCVHIIREGKPVVYTPPFAELVLLVSE